MPRIVDHNQQRDELLGKSFALFAERGYAAVTMRELARELGVSTGTLYHYFQGKEDVFAQLFGWMARRHVDGLLATLPTDEGALSARADALFDFIECHIEDLQHALALALEFRRHAAPAAQAVFARTLAFYRANLAEQLGLDPPARAEAVLSAIFGLLVHRQLAPHLDLAAHRSALHALVAPAESSPPFRPR